MAISTVDRAVTKRLISGIVDRVVFNINYSTIRVTNSASTAPLFVRTDGTDAAINGQDCAIVLPLAVREIPVVDPMNAPNIPVTVSVICAAAEQYTIEGAS